MEARRKRCGGGILKEYKNKLDALLELSHVKDRDRAYYALLLQYYLDNEPIFSTDDIYAKTFSKKLKDKKNLTTFDLSLTKYGYYCVLLRAQLYFRSVRLHLTIALNSLALHFTLTDRKSTRLNSSH